MKYESTKELNKKPIQLKKNETACQKVATSHC